MDLSTMTLIELNAMTKDQLIDALTEDRMETKTTVSKGDKRGQLREVRETKDPAGKLVSGQEVDWTYFKNGNVDIITIVDKDAKGKETSRNLVKHNEGGELTTWPWST